MMFYSVNYSQSHLQQALNKEQFIDLGRLIVDYKLTDRYTARNIYHGLVYESIDGFSSKFSAAIAAQTFTVNCKFTGYQSQLLLDGNVILGNENVLNVAESLSFGSLESLEQMNMTDGSGTDKGTKVKVALQTKESKEEI
jgi:hypothetical protein